MRLSGNVPDAVRTPSDGSLKPPKRHPISWQALSTVIFDESLPNLYVPFVQPSHLSAMFVPHPLVMREFSVVQVPSAHQSEQGDYCPRP